MRRLSCTALAIGLFAWSVGLAGPMALYTFEGDSGTTITDKLTADGAHDAINVTGNVSVDASPANAAFGDA